MVGLQKILIAAVLGMLLFPGLGFCKDSASKEEMIFNFHNVDIRTVIKSVAKITGKNFIIDPKVKGKVTIISSQTMDPEDMYDVFLSILQVHDYSAVESGNVVKIVPQAQAKMDMAYIDEKDPLRPDDRTITRLHTLKHVPADKLVPILRPLMNPKSYLAAHMDSNTIIITDWAGNISRILGIIKRIDQDKTSDIEIIRLEHADAREVARIIEGLEAGKVKGAATKQRIRLIADDRTNSILLSGPEHSILRAKVLVAHLDNPIEREGSTQVVFLRYAKAKDLVPILSGITAEEKKQKGKGAAQHIKQTDIVIQADEATNALIITASPATMKSLASVIRQLDIRRAQVLIEAVVAEVSTGKSADLGVQWRALSDTDGGGVIGGTDFTSDFSNPAAPTGGGINALSVNPMGVSSGFNLGYFNGTSTILGKEVLNLSALVSALSSDADTNVLSTPTLVTLDNEEAEIVVGENVPFATGSYTSTGSSNPDNPFTTYERKDIGVMLKITPQINEGDSVRLDISQEVSKVGQSTATPGFQSTETRSIKTTVIVEDGKILVLGGLISDDVQESVLKVPLLGDIPFLGWLFRYTYSKHEKKNLMIFLRPMILRDEASSNRIT
ncbi:type II secretion system secretin GspD, partial [Thermodesulfobacteriota bacterium]